MKETKVYVDKMPEDCWDCFCQDGENGRCKILGKYTDYVPKDCPLIDIKAHDKEKDKRIKELEQKVLELQELDNKRAFRLYCMLYDMLEEQDPENVASRIDFMTSENYADICELYKTAKNLKQHDRELVKEVCDEIKNKLDSIEDILINLGNGKEDALSYFMYILNKTQKEFEDE